MDLKIYFAGAIKAGREKVYDYAKMVEQFEKNGGKVLTKHVANPELSTKGENLTPKEVYKRDIKWLEEYDIVFADVTIASLGVGYEIAYAEKLEKKIYAVYEKNANISSLLKGNEKIELIAYSDINEITNKIDEIMKKCNCKEMK